MERWYERTRRWGQTNLTEDDPLHCDLAFWQKQWERTHIQGVIINCSGIVVYYPSGFLLQHRAMGIENRDLFGEFAAAARAAGLTVIARMDINRADKAFYDAHPDWFCADKNGMPVMAQGHYVSCVNGPYYTEYIPDVFREVIDKYHPDGFADNNWKGPGQDVICYCKNCREKFASDCGMELPEAVSWENRAYREWFRWNRKRRTELWDFFNEVTTERGGQNCIWVGMLAFDPHGLSGNLVDLNEICNRAKIIFCDHQARDRQNGFEYNGAAGTLLRLASNENVLVPESMSNYITGVRAFRISANPAPETRMWMLEGISGGISPWFHHIGGNRHDGRRFEIPVPVFEWHKQNEEYLYNREDMASVALVWSQDNAAFYGRGRAGEKTAMPWRGFIKALTKARIPYMPVNVSDIGRYAPRVKTLILPDIAVLDGAELDAVMEFVEGGGGLVFSGASATLNADGEASGDGRLWRKTGLRHTGKVMGVSETVKGDWDKYEAHSYLLLPPERHEILKAFADTRILAFGGELRVTESDGPLKPVAGYIPNFPIFPPEFSYIREERPELGTVFAGTLGGGGRAVYFAADIDRCMGRYGIPDHARLLADAVLWTLNGEKPVRVEGPGYLDCRVYRQAERVIVHIVNLSGCNVPGYCEETYPLGPVSVTVPARGRRFTRAVLTVAGKALRIEPGENARVVIDNINTHEMIVFE